MNILDVLKVTAASRIESNTAKLTKDGCDFYIEVSLLTSITNIICRRKINYPDDCENEVIRRIISINDNSLMPMGTYWINTETKELELRSNMIVDCKPTRQRLDEVISKMVACLSSSANSLECEVSRHE